MKYFLCYFLLIFAGCNSRPATQSLPFTFDQAILKENPPELIIACGTVSTADALLFKSNNSDSCIIGIVQCLSLYRTDFFRKGNSYKLQVTKDGISDSLRDWMVNNQYAGTKYPTYLITHITKVE
jgi:hypothetical protein